jgi:hypothetical protein
MNNTLLALPNQLWLIFVQPVDQFQRHHARVGLARE